MAESVTGLVLVSAASSEAQAIPGLPGLWSTAPELSVVPADLGLDVDELRAEAEALGFGVEEIEWEREVVEVVEVEAKAELTVQQIEEQIEGFSDEDLAALAQDARKGAREAAEAEIARRAEESEAAA